MGWVKAGSVKGEILSTLRVEDFTINTMGRNMWMGVQSSPWDWAGKINNNWNGGGRGLSRGFGQR